ncbi:stress responsive A/B barrel domain protein [Aspergillus flavus]|nr:stress responsive A/B barrel domain protein [Aspergillus flavus]
MLPARRDAPVTGEIFFVTLQTSYGTKEAANYVPGRYNEQDMVQDLPSFRNGSLKRFIVRPSLICSRMLGLKDTCLHPSSQKPYIRTSSGGIDDSPEGIQHGITHAFVVEFASAADRDYYVKEDPVHQEFVKSLDGVVEKAQAIDFTPGVF